MAKSTSPKSGPKKQPAPRGRSASPGGAMPAGDPAPRDGAPTHEEIQRRAYAIYLERGGTGGADVEDWVQAERELKARAGRATD